MGDLFLCQHTSQVRMLFAWRLLVLFTCMGWVSLLRPVMDSY